MPTAFNCDKISRKRGPWPASTKGLFGTKSAVFSAICAAPAVITPGKVQPGKGMDRSWAPTAIIRRLAAIRLTLPLCR